MIATETVQLSSLRPHPKNYRTHPPDQLEHIERSVREHGVYRPIVVARDGTVLAGHGLREALLKMGAATAEVVRLDVGPDEPRALKILTGDNEIAKLGEVDDRALSEILAGLKELDDLVGTGFDEMMLANLAFVTRPAGEVPDFDAAAAWAGLPEYQQDPKAFQIVVNFETAEEQAAFYKKIGQPVIHRKFGGLRVWSTWWPSRPKNSEKTTYFSEAPSK